MTKQVLRHLRVKSKEELKQRIEWFLQEVNANPAPFRQAKQAGLATYFLK
ncbi:hypothetical protein P4H65_26640 [Paenibacillus chitinolyticus]|nr:hypothetical protein [Paenibacillus chitinolyticus]MEC0249362.1 hypothetical protein [Paenibacillus chitinolyticus]